MSRLRALLIVAAWLVTIGSVEANSTGILVPVYSDPDGIGFHDPRPVASVPGNPGTTLGEQRRHVFERGLDVLASHLDSALPIRIDASFQDMGCPSPDEFLPIARGGATYYISGFPGAPHPGVNYPAAIAAHLSGAYPYQQLAEVNVFFNLRIDDEPDCHVSYPGGFWYGLGELAPPIPLSTPFIQLVLHELAHGLGIQSLTNYDSRGFFGNPPRPDIYSHFVYSTEMNLNWHQMTASQRRISSANGHRLAWSGAHGNAWAANTLMPPPQVHIDGERGSVPATVHGHRPFVPLEGLQAPLTVASNAVEELEIDGVTDDERHPDDACQPLDNAEAASGSIVMARRGGCFFATKWRHAQDAGALALLVGDNYDSGEPGAITRHQGIVMRAGMLIPLWVVSRSSAEAIFGDPPASATLGYDLSAPAAGTHDGLVGLETSSEYAEVNVHHTAVDMLPRPFMSAQHGSATGYVMGEPDLVVGMLHDLGWNTASGKQAQWEGNWYDPQRAGEGCQLTLEADHNTWILTCYFYRDGEQLWLIGDSARQQSSLLFNPMIMTRGTGYGPDFNSAEVERIPWGQIEIELYDCNHAQFLLGPDIEGFEPSNRNLQKIVDGNCTQQASAQPSREHSGNFFALDRGGEGIQIAQEANAEALVLTWYSYDDGEQLWAIGDGHLEAAGQRATFGQLYRTKGGQFGPDFDPDQVELIPFGSAQVEFLGCNDVLFSIDSALETFPSFERVMTRIVSRDC